MNASSIKTFQIYVYQLEAPEGKESFRLTQRAKWDRGYLMTSATFKNGLLAVGDALRSVDVLKFEGSKLVTVAKNCNALWPLAVGWAGNDSVISAEVRCPSVSCLLHLGHSQQENRVIITYRFSSGREVI